MDTAIIARIEAILFLESKFVSVSHIASVAELSKEEVEAAISKLSHTLTKTARGLQLIRNEEDEVTLVPSAEIWPTIKSHYRRAVQKKISNTALETLAIIAYSQPITRAEIESIRGVSVDSVIHTLLARKFIKEVGVKQTVGRPTLYGTTKNFLTAFGLRSLADLPALSAHDSARF